MAIKTFRGLIGGVPYITNGAQDTIVLHTNDGSTGYKIINFQVISYDMPGTNPEGVIQIWKTKRSGTVMPLTIDFSNQELLGAAYFSGSSSPSYTQDQVIIFDRETFNQDIYVTYNDSSDSVARTS